MPPTLLKANQNIANKHLIENNLKGALQQQNNEGSEVYSFLQDIKLEKYVDKFIDNGVEDIETILELEDNHIEQMGIPLCHKLKIVKKIKDMRAERGMTAQIKYDEGVSSRPVTQNDYEELPCPTQASTSIESEVKKPQKKVQFHENESVGI